MVPSESSATNFLDLNPTLLLSSCVTLSGPLFCFLGTEDLGHLISVEVPFAPASC